MNSNDHEEDLEEEDLEDLFAKDSAEIEKFCKEICARHGIFSDNYCLISRPTTDYLTNNEEGENRDNNSNNNRVDCFQAIISRVNKYLEKCELLDEHLERWIVPLTEDVLRYHAVRVSEILSSSSSQISSDDDSNSSKNNINNINNSLSLSISALAIHRTSKVLHAFATVRGAKTIARFFPHKARDLEPAIRTLRKFMPKRDHGQQAKYEVEGFWDRYQPQTRETFTKEKASESLFETSWETRATLLSWISVLVLMPFDFKTFSSNNDNSNSGNQTLSVSSSTSLIEDLLGMCRECVSFSEVARDRAAICVARLLTRPDAKLNLGEYLEWSTNELLRVFAKKNDDEKEGEAEKKDVIDKTVAALTASEDSFVAVGATRSMAAIFKIGRRDVLQPFREGALLAATAVIDAKASSSSSSQTTTTISNALTRQLACKLTARVALTLLAPKVASWRYSLGRRNLAENLLAGGGEKNNNNNNNNATAVTDDNDDDDDDGFASDDESDETSLEQLEKAIDLLLVALKDTDTIVRWSAAKGIGRICQRLPKQFSDDVVENLLSSCFKATESESTWHGACLALAELSRRGVLLVSRLSFTAQKAAEALLFDVRRGSHSVGAHVRDAAAYVCWSFARAYSKEDFQNVFTESLATPLLITACFDREVNVRRAASAAFQECVGRLGSGGGIVAKINGGCECDCEELCGIDIVQKCDYFTIGSARRAYLDVGFFVSQSFSSFRRAMLEHLLNVKIQHWEESTRRLSVEALGALGETDIVWTSTVALPKLLTMSLDTDLQTRHGATLGVAQLLLSENVVDYLCNKLNSNDGNMDKTLENAWNLVSEIEAKRLYRGKGGEIMRGAVCNVIESLGRLATFSSFSKTLVEIEKGEQKQQNFKPSKELIAQLCESATSESLKHPKKEIREAAARALVSIAASASSLMNEGIRAEKFAEKFLVRDRLQTMEQTINEASSFSRRGSAFTLGIVPSKFITNTNWRSILKILLEATVVEENPELRDAETRVDAVIASQNILSKLNSKFIFSSSSGRDDDNSSIDIIALADVKEAAEMCLEYYLRCVEDYSVDKRGDVGSWVREASMRAFVDVLQCFHTIHTTNSNSDNNNKIVAVHDYEAKCTNILGVLLKQCGEKIDRTRTVAFENLFTLLRGTANDTNGGSLVSRAKDFERIRLCVPLSSKDVATEAGLQCVFSNCLAKAVKVESYADYALSGWVASVGAVTESLAKAASAALLSVLSDDDTCVVVMDLRKKVALHLIETFDKYSKNDRVTVPTIRCVDVLFTGGAFDSFAFSVEQCDDTKDYRTLFSDKIRFECAGTRDVSKYILAANALSHVATCTDCKEAKESARLGLLAMMRNKFPRVRQIASEVLHMALSSEDESDENTEEAMGMLTARFWESPINADMKNSIQTIYEKLGLEVPNQQQGTISSSLTATTGASDVGVGALLKTITEEFSNVAVAVKKKDENSSYQSLVEFSGR
jgi:tubulin-specific chaperone D